jgi:hypothetical protein
MSPPTGVHKNSSIYLLLSNLVKLSHRKLIEALSDSLPLEPSLALFGPLYLSGAHQRHSVEVTQMLLERLHLLHKTAWFYPC